MEKAVNALIIQNKRLLLFKKNLVWILPGGKPKEEESDIETLVREFKEEASGAEIEVNKRDYYGSFIGTTPHTGNILEAFVYFAKLKKLKDLIVPSGEISSMLFAGFFSIYNLKISDITSKIISNLRKEKYI